MLASEASDDRICRLDTTDAAHLVRDDRLSGPATAQDDPVLIFASRHGSGDWRNEVRVVDGVGRVRPEVAVLDAELVEQRAEQPFQL